MKLNDFSDDTILTIAIADWLMGDTYEQTVRNSVSLSGDADTRTLL